MDLRRQRLGNAAYSMAFKWLEPSEVSGNDLPETVLLEMYLGDRTAGHPLVMPHAYTPHEIDALGKFAGNRHSREEPK